MSRFCVTAPDSTAQTRFERSSPVSYATASEPAPLSREDRAASSPPTFDAQRIVEVFDRHHVDYLIVGGIGAQAHGATRPTSDFDCLARFDGGNLERLCDAMRELNARIRADGLTDAEAIALAPAMLHPDVFRRVEISTWQTDAGPLDILHDIPARDGTRQIFEHLVGRSIESNLAGFRVRVAALDDIVASKEWTNRPKDHEALDELRDLQLQEPQLRPRRGEPTRGESDHGLNR
jgi:hypothetical protein